MKTIFKKKKKNDYHPYAIASYFFLVMYILKDENIKENNIKKLDNEKNNLNKLNFYNIFLLYNLYFS